MSQTLFGKQPRETKSLLHEEPAALMLAAKGFFETLSHALAEVTHDQTLRPGKP